LIREILVTHNNGIVLVARNYNRNDRIARDLVGGFISALGLFGQETFHDNLKEIKFTNSKIIFKRTAYFCVTAIVDHEDDTEEIGDLLVEISRRFELQYGSDPAFGKRFKKDTYTAFDETVDSLTRPFIEFASQVNKLILTMTTSDSSHSVADLMSAYKSKQNLLMEIRKKKGIK